MHRLSHRACEQAQRRTQETRTKNEVLSRKKKADKNLPTENNTSQRIGVTIKTLHKQSKIQRYVVRDVYHELRTPIMSG